MAKVKIAQYWGAGCGGCDVALLDIDEKILGVAEMADIAFWPIAVDTKLKDVETRASPLHSITELSEIAKTSMLQSFSGRSL